MMRWASILLRIALAAVWGTAALAAAGQVHQIIQKDRAFSVGDIAIAAGDSLAFLNQDKFLHQIYVASGGLKFDSAEQAPGEVITIAFPEAGTYEIRCHIHPKMSLKVTVQ
jgi:plastocyanin